MDRIALRQGHNIIEPKSFPRLSIPAESIVLEIKVHEFVQDNVSLVEEERCVFAVDVGKLI